MQLRLALGDLDRGRRRQRHDRARGRGRAGTRGSSRGRTAARRGIAPARRSAGRLAGRTSPPGRAGPCRQLARHLLDREARPSPPASGRCARSARGCRAAARRCPRGRGSSRGAPPSAPPADQRRRGRRRRSSPRPAPGSPSRSPSMSCSSMTNSIVMPGICFSKTARCSSMTSSAVRFRADRGFSRTTMSPVFCGRREHAQLRAGPAGEARDLGRVRQHVLDALQHAVGLGQRRALGRPVVDDVPALVHLGQEARLEPREEQGAEDGERQRDAATSAGRRSETPEHER